MLIEFIIFCIGLIFGSFVTCASYRLPLGIDIIRKPSYCPKCEAKLGFKDLWPVLSWLLSLGRCRHCRTAISPRYPLIELITGALFVFIYTRYGLTFQGLILMATIIILMIMIIADLEHFIIPDFVHIALLPLAFAYRYINGTLSADILWGFALMLALALLLHYGYSHLRGRVMLGFGDVKFFAVTGVWLDISAIPAFLLLAGVLGIVFGLIWRLLGKGQLFPFGPALAASLLSCLVYPESANLMLL